MFILRLKYNSNYEMKVWTAMFNNSINDIVFHCFDINLINFKILILLFSPV
jgi:hypothetical protein